MVNLKLLNRELFEHISCYIRMRQFRIEFPLHSVVYLVDETISFNAKNTRWNDKIVALEKTTFPFHENRFSFLVADHLLVGQLCTNPKSDRSLLSCLEVTQCSTCEIGDTPLYNSCSLPIQVMTTWPLPAHSKCKSGWFNAWGHSSTHRKTLWRWWSGRPHHATSHLRSRLESQHQSVPGCVEECGDPLVQSGGRWQTLGVAAGPKVQRDPGLASEGVPRLCTLLSLPSHSPDLNPLDYFVWSYIENITNMTSHNTKGSLIASIRRVFAKLPLALMESMLPVPDPYQGGDWGWRRLHWIDVSSTT